MLSNSERIFLTAAPVQIIELFSSIQKDFFVIFTMFHSQITIEYPIWDIGTSASLKEYVRR